MEKIVDASEELAGVGVDALSPFGFVTKDGTSLIIRGE